jgi:hypothetical protein
MNSKSTWVWITIAAVLFAAVLAVEKFGQPKPPELVPLLPEFKAAAVTSVQFTPAGQLEIRADRTNRTWQLVRPITYPAQAASVEALLQALERLAPALIISAVEIRQRTNSDAEFGFLDRTTLTLFSGAQSRQLVIGTHTAPGDQIYVQVVGTEGVFIVDARLLQFLPGKVDDWRDTGLLDLRTVQFDYIAVSNATTPLVHLKQENSNSLWRLTYPLAARADNFRLADSLQRLHVTRVTSFVTDDPRSDADSFGFQNPELELTFAQGTNPVVTVQFGKSPTNDSTQIYARRAGFPTIVTVERQLLDPWLVPLEKFRDPFLVTRQRVVDQIEVTGTENFVLQRVNTNSWKLVDSELPMDPGFVGQLLITLVAAPIVEFRDSITEADLPKYGLTTPVRQIKLRAKVTNGATNDLIAELALGEIKEGIGYVRRADENPVYAVGIEDFARLNVASWRLRDRKIWRFSETNVVRVIAQRAGNALEVRRLGANSWTFGAGSQGILNGAGVEETVHRFGELDALEWIGQGEDKRAEFEFGPDPLTVTFELKDGTKQVVEFGGVSPNKSPYAAVKIGAQTWFFECPLVPLELLKFYLLNPAATP